MPTQIERLVIAADMQTDRASAGARRLQKDMAGLGGVTRQTGQWFRDTDQHVGKLTGNVSRSTGPIGRMTTVTEGLGFGFTNVATAAPLAGAAALTFYKSSIDAASNLAETQSKVRVVFGGSAEAILTWGRSAASAIGMSEQQAEEAAGTFGNLFVSMKIGQQPAADMSKRLVNLAGDLASFNNVDPAEALDALRSGLVGETEPLRRFGVNLNDADLRQRALKLGLVDTTKNVLPPAARAQAAYSLILEQTKTAQGDYARTSGGLANQTRTLTANIENLKASVGTGLAPALGDVTKAANLGARALGFLNERTDGFVTKSLLLGPPIALATGGISAFNRVIHHGADEQKRATGIGQAAAGAVSLLGKTHTEAAPKIASTGPALESYRIAVHANNVEIGKAIPIFQGYVREAGITARAVVRNLRQEVGAYSTWAKDTQTLIRRGADPHFVRELSAKGPQYVHAMATASDRELATAQRFFRDRMAEIRRLTEAQLRAAGRNAPVGFAAQMRAQGGTVGAAATAVAKSATGPLRGIRDDAPGWGRGLAHNFAAGIQSRSSMDAARAASRRLGISVTNVLRFSAGPREGPLAAGGGPYVWGQHFAEKYAAGMASKYGLWADTGAGLAGSLGAPIRGNVQSIVHRIAASRGWGSGSQWAALSQLISHESGWRPTAQNPTSTAYGLFQFLNCVPLDTECLTQDGWKRHDEIRVGDKTLGYNPASGRLEWTSITAVIAKPAEQVIEIGRRGWRTRTTPGHRWWSERVTSDPVPSRSVCPECGATGGKRGRFTSTRAVTTHLAKAHGILRTTPPTIRVEEFVTSDAITTAHRLRLAANADTDGNDRITPDEAAIIGWLLTDGHIHRKGGTLAASIYQSKPAMVPVLDALLAEVPHTRTIRARPGTNHPAVTWYLHARYARDLLARSRVEELGPELFVLGLSAKQRARWLEAAWQAEGSTWRSGEGGELRQLAQRDGPIQDAIVLAAYLEGYRPTRRRLAQREEHHQPAQMIGLARPWVGGTTLYRKDLGRQPVWCVQTGLGTWTMRQDGHVMVTGNSTWGGTGVRKTSDPAMQTVAGLRYIASRYGSPVGAWNFWRAHRWYHAGLDGTFTQPTVIGVGEAGPERVTVTPLGQGGARRTTVVQVSMDFRGATVIGDQRKFEQAIAPGVRNAINAVLRQEGKKPL